MLASCHIDTLRADKPSTAPPMVLKRMDSRCDSAMSTNQERIRDYHSDTKTLLQTSWVAKEERPKADPSPAFPISVSGKV